MGHSTRKINHCEKEVKNLKRKPEKQEPVMRRKSVSESASENNVISAELTKKTKKVNKLKFV